MRSPLLAILPALLLAAGCSPATPAADAGLQCVIAAGADAPDSLASLGCAADFEALASLPLDVTLPGARSVKVILDQATEPPTLYFQNSRRFEIHYAFASTHLSGGGLPIVTSLSTFNTTEYFSPERRFVLGALTHYEGPGAWALELAPYDTASVAMMKALFQAVKAKSFVGDALVLHPTSDAVLAEATRGQPELKLLTTEQLYAAIDYQPLTLGSAIGRVRFVTAAELETQYLSYQDLVVLDAVPNDISVVQGMITQEFQTPLSHINVLSANRHTPNMGLRGAMTNATLRALEGKLARLTVSATGWTIAEATQVEAEAFWLANKPAPVTLPALDLTVTGLHDIELVAPDPTDGGTLRNSLKAAVSAFGGKCAHYSVLRRTQGVPIKKAFGIPLSYYDKFMRENGLYTRLDALLADSAFRTDPAYRDLKLREFRNLILAGNLDATLMDALRAKIAAEYAGAKIRFRTSTNSEDLEGFPCSGCYDSHTGNPAAWTTVLDAIRQTYATAWKFRTFEERSFYGIDHKSVAMGLLVHTNFPDEEANGVAVTANPFDASGLDPAFYVNVQFGGDAEVVAPPPGVKSDELLYFFQQPNQPTTYLTHSSLIDAGTTVLTTTQLHQLGTALDAIHKRFSPAYGPAAGNNGWYAMDVEFKFDDADAPGQPPTLFIKQARPYPGRGN